MLLLTFFVGTVVVEPEAVDDSKTSFKGPEFGKSRRSRGEECLLFLYIIFIY